MYRKILLAYDGSSHSSAALRQSADLALHCNAELHLLGVVPITTTITIAEGYGGGTDVWGMEEDSLRNALLGAVDQLDEPSITISTSIRFGSPGTEIANAAHEIGADLVVVGHSGKGVLARLFQGSVGAELLNNLPCSLLIAIADT